jgi:UDP-N-acetylglucosamine/UDP-N-acetylgalactosamine diphosphorylase
VTAAGTIYRKDETRPNRLLFERGGRGGSVPFKPGQYHNTGRIITNNIIYIANMMALRQWYRQVRACFVSADFPESLLIGLNTTIDLAVAERTKRLKDFYHKLAERDRPRPWDDVHDMLDRMSDFEGDLQARDAFLEKISMNIDRYAYDYLTVIKNLKPDDAALGTLWLQGIVDAVSAACL